MRLFLWLGTFQKDAKHTAQRLGCSPEELVANGEGSEIVGAHLHFPESSDGDLQRATDGSGGQLLEGCFLIVGDDPCPIGTCADDRLDVGEGEITVKFDGEGLAVAAHGTDAHAKSVDRDGCALATENFVGFCLAFPLFARLSIFNGPVDPRDEAGGEGGAELTGGKGVAADVVGDGTVDIENSGGGIVEVAAHSGSDGSHLHEQFAHVACACAGSALVGHGGGPLDQALAEEAIEAHEHEADGAVAADKGMDAIVESGIDHITVDRVEDDNGIVLHTQGGGGIDPVSLPACCAQLRIDAAGVVTALAGDDDLAVAECSDIVGIAEWLASTAHVRALLPDLTGGEEKGLESGCKIVFLAHASEQNGADHAAPSNKTYLYTHLFTLARCLHILNRGEECSSSMGV